MAMIFVLTMRGTPQLYYGTEILMDNPGTESHGIIRSDFPGGWQTDVRNAFTGQGLTQEENDAQRFVRKLLQWRKNAPAIHAGKLMHYIPENGIYTYFRYREDEKVMIILNKNSVDTKLSLNRFEEILQGVTSATDVISERQFIMKDFIRLDPQTSYILDLK